jgi:hypothetical protein
MLETIPKSKRESLRVNMPVGKLFWKIFPVSILIKGLSD